ncbi:hypothetical protein N7520_010204 [Penicillium odoratum]|uniref:uncharacterized protein n=1 Tax=Penicillium odoratum TaxID=1167516 RepID=UPI0025472D39|nr:uncharacterized protein N7520_010204 [Penicillium odoratum]KAJ5753287.1 hypothetical protein N7520_010204 [Penicillium odoratum]
MILVLEANARKHLAVGTVRVIESSGASSNTIPGWASFTIDIRHPSDEVIDSIMKEVNREMHSISKENPRFSFRLEQVWESLAATFDKIMLDYLRNAAQEEVGLRSILDIISFAGHDSAMTTLKVPTAMLFVPCRNRISHSPVEFTTKAQCRDRVQILLNAILKYDTWLVARHTKM